MSELVTRVYVIQCGVGPVKVGTSKQPAERIRVLQPGSPYPLHILAEIEGDLAIEYAIHKELEGQRLCGEWFINEGKTRQVIYDWFGIDMAFVRDLEATGERLKQENQALRCQSAKVLSENEDLRHRLVEERSRTRRLAKASAPTAAELKLLKQELQETRSRARELLERQKQEFEYWWHHE